MAGLIIGNNFDYQGKKPNFARDTFSTKAEMKNYPTTSIDEGHLSTCLEDGKKYIFSTNNNLSEETGYWRKLVDAALDESSENPVQNKVIAAKFNEISSSFTGNLEEIENAISTLDSETRSALSGLETREDEKIAALSGKHDQDIADLQSDISEDFQELEERWTGALGAAQTTINNKFGEIEDNIEVISTTTAQAFSDIRDSIAEVEGLGEHILDTNNPHRVTAAQVGLGDFAGFTPRTLPITTAQELAFQNINNELDLHSGRIAAVETGKVDKVTKVNGHSLENDVTVTKGDLGLGNVDNTSDADKPISTAQQAALDNKADKEDENVLSLSILETNAKLVETIEVAAQAICELRGENESLQRQINDLVDRIVVLENS